MILNDIARWLTTKGDTNASGTIVSLNLHNHRAERCAGERNGGIGPNETEGSGRTKQKDRERETRVLAALCVLNTDVWTACPGKRRALAHISYH